MHCPSLSPFLWGVPFDYFQGGRERLVDFETRFSAAFSAVFLIGLFIVKYPVVRRVDNFIQRINPYPVDKTFSLTDQNQKRANFIHWIGIFPLDEVNHSSYNRATGISSGLEKGVDYCSLILNRVWKIAFSDLK